MTCKARNCSRSGIQQNVLDVQIMLNDTSLPDPIGQAGLCVSVPPPVSLFLFCIAGFFSTSSGRSDIIRHRRTRRYLSYFFAPVSVLLIKKMHFFLHFFAF